MNSKPSSLINTTLLSANDQSLAESVSSVLTSLEPIFRHEGGMVKLISVKDNVAHLELTSESCEGCGSGLAGMEGGLRLMLLERVPNLKEVIFE